MLPFARCSAGTVSTYRSRTVPACDGPRKSLSQGNVICHVTLVKRDPKAYRTAARLPAGTPVSVRAADCVGRDARTDDASVA